MAITIKDLAPREVWKHFESLTQVPRPSGHLEKIQKFLHPQRKITRSVLFFLLFPLSVMKKRRKLKKSQKTMKPYQISSVHYPSLNKKYI